MNESFMRWFDGLKCDALILSEVWKLLPADLSWISTYQFNRAFSQAGGEIVTAGAGTRYIKRTDAPSRTVRVFGDSWEETHGGGRVVERPIEYIDYSDTFGDWYNSLSPGIYTYDDAIRAYLEAGELAPSRKRIGMRFVARGGIVRRTSKGRILIKPSPAISI